jgi:hypothetical protein
MSARARWLKSLSAMTLSCAGRVAMETRGLPLTAVARHFFGVPGRPRRHPASSAVPTILEVVCNTTGMGFAAIARVTSERWACLASHDEIGLGLKPGGELAVDTTLCHEVRLARGVVAIDHVAEDAAYRLHRTTAMYGFQSYISMPMAAPSSRVTRLSFMRWSAGRRALPDVRA